MYLDAVCEWADERGYNLVKILLLVDVALIVGLFFLAYRLR